MKKLVLYSFILAMANCNKYDDTVAASHLQLPPFTETGANTFGCLINGQVWANFGETFVKPAEDFLGDGKLEPNLVRASINFDNTANDSTLFLTGTYTLSKNGTVLKESMLELFVPKGGGFVGIHQLSSGSGAVDYTQMVAPFTTYRNITRNPFTVIIKKDSVTAGSTHIVSGTFSGMVYNYNQTDSLNMVGGVFDASFQ